MAKHRRSNVGRTMKTKKNISASSFLLALVFIVCLVQIWLHSQVAHTPKGLLPNNGLSDPLRRDVALPEHQAAYDERTLLDIDGEKVPLDEVKDIPEHQPCAYYLAESSIDAGGFFPGFGIFAGHRITKGTLLLYGSEGPLVQILDPKLHHKPEPEWAQTILMWDVKRHLFKDSDKGFETGPNLVVMINHHSLLSNAIADLVNTTYNDTLLNRFSDPGAGAISYHTGMHFKAEIDILPGEEIFEYYGEDYMFRHITLSGGDVSTIPTIEDHESAARALKKLLQDKNGEIRSDMLLNLQKEVRSNSTLAASLLPTDGTKLEEYFKVQRERPEFGAKEILAYLQLNRRTPEWLEEHGRCLDHIKPGMSTISGAGQGAFARRFLAQDSIIVPIPLLVTVADKKSLDMYKLVKQKRLMKRDPNATQPVGKQLLMNYCFGHPRSTMLVCAGSNVNLINHCSPRTDGPCGPDGPNAKLQWAVDFDPATPEWLDKTVDEIKQLVKKGKRGLSLEVVATRNIEAGEEIFLDYGMEWEEAWANHVANWTPPVIGSGFDSFASVTDMNNKMSPVKTEDELISDPYPSNIATICSGPKGTQYLPCKILSRGSCPDANDTNHEDCEYTVLKNKYDYHGNEVETNTSKPKNITRNNIMFTIKKYTSDAHLPGAFRHFIGVPDEIWPEQWKNL